MPRSLKQLLASKSPKFLEMVLQITNKNDFKLQDPQGNYLFEVLLNEAFTKNNPVFKTWLHRLKRQYSADVDLNEALRKEMQKKEAINVEKVIFLLQLGASPHTNTDQLLDLLIKNKKFAFIKQLKLTKHIDVNRPITQNRSGLSVLLDQEPLDIQGIITLLEQGAHVNTTDANGNTIMHLLVKLAVKRKTQEPGLVRFFEFLRADKESPLGLLTRAIAGPAKPYSSFWSDAAPLVKKLIAYGADLNLVNNNGESIFTPLFNNRNTHFNDFLDLMRLGIKPEQMTLTVEDKHGTIEHMAMSSKEQAKLLKTKRETQKSIPRNVLSPAARRQDPVSLLHDNLLGKFNEEVVLELLRNDYVNIDSPDRYGKTALQKALDLPITIDFNLATKLIELGANPNTKNAAGNTLLHLLTNEKFKTRNPIIDKMIDKVIAHGGDISATNIADRTPLQEALAHEAVRWRWGTGIAKWGDFMDMIRRGADPNTAAFGNMPIVHMAAAGPVLEDLVTHYNADINIKMGGKTLLEIELNNRPRNITSILQCIKLGADLNGKTLATIFCKERVVTHNELIAMERSEKYSSHRFLYKLLVNNKARESFSDDFYQTIKNHKAAIFHYIANLKDETEKVHALLDALDPNMGLGRLMWTKRGWLNPDIDNGYLGQCHHALIEILRFPLVDNDPAVLSRILTHSTLPQAAKDFVLHRLSNDNVIALFNYIKYYKEEVKLLLNTINADAAMALFSAIQNDDKKQIEFFLNNIKKDALETIYHFMQSRYFTEEQRIEMLLNYQNIWESRLGINIGNENMDAIFEATSKKETPEAQEPTQRAITPHSIPAEPVFPLRSVNSEQVIDLDKVVNDFAIEDLLIKATAPAGFPPIGITTETINPEPVTMTKEEWEEKEKQLEQALQEHEDLLVHQEKEALLEKEREEKIKANLSLPKGVGTFFDKPSTEEPSNKTKPRTTTPRQKKKEEKRIAVPC